MMVRPKTSMIDQDVVYVFNGHPCHLSQVRRSPPSYYASEGLEGGEGEDDEDGDGYDGYDDGFTNEISRDLLRRHYMDLNDSNTSVWPLPNYHRRPSLVEFGGGPLSNPSSPLPLDSALQNSPESTSFHCLPSIDEFHELQTQHRQLETESDEAKKEHQVPPTRPNTPTDDKVFSARSSISSTCTCLSDFSKSSMISSVSSNSTCTLVDPQYEQDHQLDTYNFSDHLNRAFIAPKASSITEISETGMQVQVSSCGYMDEEDVKVQSEEEHRMTKPQWLPKSYTKQWGRRRGAICEDDQL